MSPSNPLLTAIALLGLVACSESDNSQQADNIMTPQSTNQSNPISQQQGTEAAGLRFDSGSQPFTPLSEQENLSQ